MAARADTDPAFLADAMLRGLARWLRVLGFDTEGDYGDPDAWLARRAATGGRILLTRDRPLARAPGPARVLWLEQDEPLRQLREVLETLNPPLPSTLFSRCLLCNTPVRAAGAEIREQVPQPAREESGPFHYCPDCGRVYWPGSHTRHMREQLEARLPEWFRPA